MALCLIEMVLPHAACEEMRALLAAVTGTIFLVRKLWN